VRLIGVDRVNRARDCTLLTPFDEVVRVEGAWRPRVVSRRRWMRAFGELVAEAQPREVPLSAAGADAALLPHQLDPLLALLRGEASRLLIADEVGLGKTVQAVLIVRELAARGRADRVLIVTPAGLRDQWQGELRERGGLMSHVADAEWLAAMRRELPGDVNPWGMRGLHVTSLDFIKQADVLHGLDRLSWDVLVIDEAHALAAGSDRAAAAQRLARRSRVVVLLTATPHSGSTADFETLCGTGAAGAGTRAGEEAGQDDDGDRDGDGDDGGGGGSGSGSGDRLLMFRRARARGGRRVHVLRVRPTDDERRLHELLERYVGRVERQTAAGDPARLAMAVLRKRACSSAWSLERSLRRRWLLVAERGAEPEQGRLPFWSLPEEVRGGEADDDEPVGILGAVGLPVRHEKAWLTLLGEVARRAARGDSKIAALRRLLRRTAAAGESVVVFTEYRDTLTHIADVLRRTESIATALLHGGLGAEGRRLALERFVRGEVRVLLTTDAAGEGLNLQQRCRVVLQMELPWNPIRIEQRVGRVDRIGQRRTVHAWQLVASGTYEERVLRSVTDRLSRIREAIGDQGGVVAGALRRAGIGGEAGDEAGGEAPGQAAGGRVADPALLACSLRRVVSDEAKEMVRRLTQVRRLREAPRLHGTRVRSIEERAPWVAFVRSVRRGPFRDLAPGLVCLWRVQYRATDGSLVETRLVPLQVPVWLPRRMVGARAAVVRAALREWREAMQCVIDRPIAGVCRELCEVERPWRARAQVRDAAIAELLRSQEAGLEQPSLFGEFAPAAPLWKRAARGGDDVEDGDGSEAGEDEGRNEDEDEDDDEGEEEERAEAERARRWAGCGGVAREGIAAESRLLMVLVISPSRDSEGERGLVVSGSSWLAKEAGV
jgi:superfamily II DNA or RNA helicase